MITSTNKTYLIKTLVSRSTLSISSHKLDNSIENFVLSSLKQTIIGKQYFDGRQIKIVFAHTVQILSFLGNKQLIFNYDLKAKCFSTLQDLSRLLFTKRSLIEN